jgi:hypothetical protein
MGGSWLCAVPLVGVLTLTLDVLHQVDGACFCVVVALSGQWGAGLDSVRTPLAGCSLFTCGGYIVGSLDRLSACRRSQQQDMHFMPTLYIACPHQELACAAPGVLRIPLAWLSAVRMLLFVVSAQQDTVGWLCLP